MKSIERVPRKLKSSLVIVIALGQFALVSAWVFAQSDGPKAEAPAQIENDKLSPREYFRTWRVAQEMLQKKQFAEARPYFEKLVKQCPTNGDLWLQTARCQAADERPGDAIASFERANELGAGTPHGNARAIGRQYGILGDRDKAFEWVDRALEQRLENRTLLFVDLQLPGFSGDQRLRRVTGKPPLGDVSRDDRWRYDLDFLMSEAQRMHPDLYRRTPKEQLEAAAASLRQRIPELTDAQILVEMQRIVYLFGDGHSVIFPNWKGVTPRQIPVRFYWFSDGLFAIDADASRADLIGCKVERVGQKPLDDVTRALESYVSRDNPMGVKWIGPGVLTRPDVLHGLGLIETPDKLSLEVVDREGSRRTVDVPGGPMQMRSRLPGSKLKEAPAAPLHLKNLNLPFWSEHLADDKLLYVQFNQVSDGPKETLAAFSARLKEDIDQRDPDTLVIDVRHNGGGNTFLNVPLLRTLVYFEVAREGRRLFAIIGRNTFSAAMNFTTDVDRLTNAVFVGEPTGSSPNMIGESTDVVLPYNGTKLSISTLRWGFSYPMDYRIWIAPDIPAELSSSDYFANQDPAMDAILQIVRDRP